MRDERPHLPVANHRIQSTRLGAACLLLFAVIYIALGIYLTLALGAFSLKTLFFWVACVAVWLLCARVLRRQHVGLLACKNNAWTWEPIVRAGAPTHHPVVDVTLGARFDWQHGMLLRFELHETNDEGDTLGTTVLWLLALRRHASTDAAWQDLRRAVYAPDFATGKLAASGLGL